MLWACQVLASNEKLPWVDDETLVVPSEFSKQKGTTQDAADIRIGAEFGR